MKPKFNILSVDGNNDQGALSDHITEKSKSYQLHSVRTLKEARKILGSMDIDLILTEYKIGDFTAFDLVADVEDLPWIMITRQGGEKIALQAFKFGATDCILADSHNDYLPELMNSIERTLLRLEKDKQAQEYQQNLEEIVADRTHVLIESNQRLTEETLYRTQALEDLKESREIYRRFFQTSKDAMFVTSTNGRWIDMNESTLRLFEYQDEEQIWNDSVMDLFWNSEDRAEYMKVIEQEGFLKDYPLKFKKKDGSKIETLVSATPYEIGGKLVGYQGFIHDITDKLLAEDEKEQTRIQQELIDDLAIEMGTSLKLEDMYHSIAIHAQELIKADGLNIFKYDQSRKLIQLEYVWDRSNPAEVNENNRDRFDSLDQDLRHQFLNDKVPLIIDRLAQYRDENDLGGDDDGNCATLLAPVVVDDKVIAVLQLLSRQADSFNNADLLLITRMANVVAIGLQKAYLFQESQVLVKKLSSLQRIEQVILENLSLPSTLDILVDNLVGELGVHAADILYFHPILKSLKFITQTGFRENILQHTDLEIGEGLAGQAAETKKMVQVLDLSKDDRKDNRSADFNSEGFVSYFAVPLHAKNRIVGVLEIFHREKLDPGQDWIDLLEMIAGLAALAIDNQNLHDDLIRSRNKITLGFDAIIRGWAQAMELRGIESEGHWRRVEELTMKLAAKLGLEGDTLIDLQRGALLHDIGKMGIPDQILLKNGRLTKEERKQIGRHPLDAYELLQPIDGLGSALDIPLYHHERWDGNGYPHGIESEDIPLPARIFAVVDVWDALQSGRPYRKAFTRSEALLHMKKQSGKHFDPRVVKVFLDLIEEDYQEDQQSPQELDLETLTKVEITGDI
ncbi:MAG: HD domain-containing phosphohydrolase [Anaerolineales bacterium]